LVKGGGAEVDGLEGSNVGEELGHKRAAWGRMPPMLLAQSVMPPPRPEMEFIGEE
jgi:hypothetical protein